MGWGDFGSLDNWLGAANSAIDLKQKVDANKINRSEKRAKIAALKASSKPVQAVYVPQPSELRTQTSKPFYKGYEREFAGLAGLIIFWAAYRAKNSKDKK